MKKNIFAMAIATCAAVASVQATASAVDFYGEIGFGVESIDGVDDLSLTSQHGKLGLTGQAESTKDYTFDYQVELALGTVGIEDQVTVSKANITVGGKIGDLTIGRHTDLVKEAVTDLVDVFAYQADEPAQNDAITLKVVEFGKLSVSASGIIDSTSEDMFDTTKMGASFKASDRLTVAAFHESDKDSVADDVNTMGVSGGLTAGNIYVSAMWQSIDNGTNEVAYTYLASAYTVDSMTISGSLKSNDGNDSATTRVGADYSFGANAVAYVDYSMANDAAEAAGENDTFATGVRVSF
jgi:predicted porin